MGTNKCASQSGMTAYGTRRHLYDPKNHILPPMDHSTISLQMGTNKCASQVGLAASLSPQPVSCRAKPASPLTPPRWARLLPVHLGCSVPASACCVSLGELPPSSGVCLEAHPTLNFLDPAIITFPAVSPVEALCRLWSTWILGEPRLPFSPSALTRSPPSPGGHDGSRHPAAHL